MSVRTLDLKGVNGEISYKLGRKTVGPKRKG